MSQTAATFPLNRSSSAAVLSFFSDYFHFWMSVNLFSESAISPKRTKIANKGKTSFQGIAKAIFCTFLCSSSY